MNLIQNRIRVYAWFFKAAWRRHWKRVILSLGACAVLLPLIIFLNTSYYNKSSSTKIIGVVGQTSLSDLPLEVSTLLGTGLTKLSDKGLPEPNLAEGWEITDSGREYIFHLKRGLYWHDGKPIYSDSISIILPDVKITYPDSYTIKAVLKEPFAPLLAVISRPILRGTGLIGSGEYRVKSLESNENKKLTKLVVENRSSYERLIYKFYENEKSAAVALRMGEIDLLGSFNELGLDDARSILVAKPVSHRKVIAILFNVNDPVINEKSVRQGLGYLLDVSDKNEEALGPIPPGSWAFNPDVKRIRNNIEQARRLLEKKQMDLSKQPLVISCTPQLASLGQAIVQSWHNGGLNSELKVERGLLQNFQIYLTMLDIPLETDQYAMWHSAQSTNITQYDSKRVDKLLEDARQHSDLSERKAKYQEFQRYLVEDAPALFLYYPKYYIYYNSKLAEPDVIRLKKRLLE